MARRKPLSARVVATLRAKAKTRKNITYGQLVKVYRRGQGAWLSGGSRPRIPMAAWSMARVNSFLRGSKNHLAHMKKDIDRILYSLGAIGLLVIGQLLYIITK